VDSTAPKLDGLSSLIRQLGKDIGLTTAAIEAHTQAMSIQANAFDTMATAFGELLEAITAEPEEGENLGDILRTIIDMLKGLPEAISKQIKTDAKCSE
jgi:hypothetical protein